MKVKDLTAELISEIASEFGYVVYRFECTSPSAGNICFEAEILDEGSTRFKYKSLSYSGHKVNLMTSKLLKAINLHHSNSLEEVRDWFKNIADGLDAPFGSSATYWGYTSFDKLSSPLDVYSVSNNCKNSFFTNISFTSNDNNCNLDFDV